MSNKILHHLWGPKPSTPDPPLPWLRLWLMMASCASKRSCTKIMFLNVQLFLHVGFVLFLQSLTRFRLPRCRMNLIIARWSELCTTYQVCWLYNTYIRLTACKVFARILDLGEYKKFQGGCNNDERFRNSPPKNAEDREGGEVAAADILPILLSKKPGWWRGSGEKNCKPCKAS